MVSVEVLVVGLHWVLISLEDIVDREVPVHWLHLTTAIGLLLFNPNTSAIYTLPIYIAAVLWTWKHPGVKTGDTIMLTTYAATTANNPLTGLRTLFLISGIYIIAANQLDKENTAFAPVFLISYLLTQLVH